MSGSILFAMVLICVNLWLNKEALSAYRTLNIFKDVPLSRKWFLKNSVLAQIKNFNMFTFYITWLGRVQSFKKGSRNLSLFYEYYFIDLNSRIVRLAIQARNPN